MSTGPLAALNEAMKKLNDTVPTIECPSCQGDVLVSEGFAPALGKCRQCGHRVTMLVIDLDMDLPTLADRLAVMLLALRYRLPSE